jgi:hypothetical protein
MRFPVSLCLLVAMVLSGAAAAQVHLLDLKVLNGSDQARVNEPVSFGIPVAEQADLYYLDWFQVVDASNQVVPAQFKVLTRWGGERGDLTKPIRWALVSFRATVPANSHAMYYITHGAPPAPGELWASDQMHHIEVHTGPNTWFKIYKWQFHLFEGAIVNGVSLVNPGRIDFVSGSGPTPNVVVTETALEEYAGWQSVRCVVRQRGQIGQLRFTCRWYFHTGRSDVMVDFRLENPNAYGLFSTTIPDGQQYVESLYLVQPVIGTAPYTVTTDNAVRSVGAAQVYDLRQTYSAAVQTDPLDIWTGFSFAETINGGQVGSGNRFAGAVDLRGSAGGVTVTLDRFWQNFPKSFRSQSGELQIGLWPEWGNGPEYGGQYGTPTTPVTDPLSMSSYRFEGGRWKTHRMVFNFHQGSTTTGAVAAECARVNTPLIGTPPPSWIRLSGALGKLWIERKPTSEVNELRWERFTDILGDDAAADVTQAGQIGYPAFLRRGGTNGGGQTYGWENFGDLPWGDGYCSQHYDWTAAFMSGFWRTGDYRLFNIGRDVAVSRRDYNQNHSTNPSELWRGASFYEKGYWHGNYVSGIASHNWVEGLLMYYAITGDEAAREAAIENGAFILRDPPKNWTGYWGSRIPGWAIDNLMSLYAFIGSPAYLTEAGLGVHRYEQLELGQGGHGYVLNPANNATQSWMENIMHIAACKYYLVSGDASVLPLLGRMRDFYKNELCFLPVGTLPNITLPQVFEHFSPGSLTNISLHHDWAMSESFAYSAVVFNSQDDLTWARAYHDGVSRYWQSGPGLAQFNVLNSATYSAITFRPGMYPGSESKVIANLLRWGGGTLAARALLQP